MDRSSDKDRSSGKRSRDDRDHRDSTKDREHKHRSRDKERERDSDSHSRRHHHRLERDYHKSSSSKREDRERSRDRESSKPREDREREKSREREVIEEDGEEEEVYRRKRKERGGSEDKAAVESEKRARVSVSEQKRERRRFGDKVKQEEEDEEKDDGYGITENLKGALPSEIKVEKEEQVEVNDYELSRDDSIANGSLATENGVAQESFIKTESIAAENSTAHVHPLPTKVSSISNTNENKGVSITRSHEVPGKSSTDGTSSAAGKSGSLSLDALAKAKKALQMQKELSEKLKKIPQLSKTSGSDNKAISVTKLESSSTQVAQGSAPLTSAAVIAAGAASISSTSGQPQASGMASVPELSSIQSIEAVKRAQELAAKMGFRQDQYAPLINLFPGQVPVEVPVPQKPTKAPVLRIDALGREIDEHGHVVNVTKPSNLSTLKVNINKQKKEAFQILKPELDIDPESNPHFDPRMGINKTKLLRPKRMSFQFVEEGKWSRDAEAIRLRSKYGEEKAKDEKARRAIYAKAKVAPDINPNLIEVAERVIVKEKPKEPIPEIEWWDAALLSGGTYDEIDDFSVSDKLKMEKITIYVEHPRPIEPPAEPAPPPPQPLKLTKKEQKKLRTQRRLAREKDRQEMIRQGLIEPPKPKVKMSNLMKVLGSEATQDPTRLEKEIRTAAAEREQAHIDRNVARKLTPAERREKKERRLFDDPNTVETIVSVYKINDLSHKKTRFKVDVNAHENRLTGCAVISEGINIVVVEGGSKSIKRYGKLMLRRINWAEAVAEEEEEEEEGMDSEEKPVNKCALVWQGSVAKPSFNRFSVHECVTEAAARKVFADAGVAHYWDLAVNFSDDQM